MDTNVSFKAALDFMGQGGGALSQVFSGYLLGLLEVLPLQLLFGAEGGGQGGVLRGLPGQLGRFAAHGRVLRGVDGDARCAGPGPASDGAAAGCAAPGVVLPSLRRSPRGCDGRGRSPHCKGGCCCGAGGVGPAELPAGGWCGAAAAAAARPWRGLTCCWTAGGCCCLAGGGLRGARCARYGVLLPDAGLGGRARVLGGLPALGGLIPDGEEEIVLTGVGTGLVAYGSHRYVTGGEGLDLGARRRDAAVAYLPGRAPRARRSTNVLDDRPSLVAAVDCARAGGAPGFMLSACLRLLAALDEVVVGPDVLRVVRSPPEDRSLVRAAALFLDPSDPVAAGFRAGQLRQAIRERDPGPPTEDRWRQGLADLLCRDVIVLTCDPGKSWVTLPAWGATGRRVSPVFLLASLVDPYGQWAYDAVVGRLPLVCEEPPVPVPSPVVPGIVPLLHLSPGASLDDGALGLSAPDVGLRPAPSPRVRAMINLATWNVRGAARAGAKEAIDAALLGRDVHVAVLQETRLPRQQLHTDHYRWVLEGAPRRGGRGLALLVRRGLPDVVLRSTALVHPNVLMAEALLWGMNFTLVGAHVPSDAQRGQRGVLDAISATLAAAQPRHWRVLLADGNAHIGRHERAHFPEEVGPRLFHEASNTAGVGLLSIARTHRLKGARVGRRGRPDLNSTTLSATTGSGRGSGRTSPSFIALTTSSWSRRYPSRGPTRCPTSRVPLPQPPPPRVTNPHETWATAALARSQDLQQRYQAAVGAAVATRTARGADLTWPQLGDILVTAANAVLAVPASPLTPRQLAADAQLRAASGRAHNDPGDPHAQRLLREAVRARRAAGRQHRLEKLELQLHSIQGCRPARRLDVLFKFLRRSRRIRAARGGGVPDIRQWEEAAEGVHPPLLPEEPQPRDLAPTSAQLRCYASRLTSGTAPGPDGLPGELLKYAPDSFFDQLGRLVRRCWAACAFPSQWTTSLQHPIPKVPRPQGVDDYRTLSMCQVVYKLLALHLLAMLQDVIPPVPSYQTGFQAGRSTYHHIFTVRRVLDECWRAGVPVHVLGLDIKAAFPSVQKASVVRALQDAGVPPSLINRVIALALTDRTYVRWGAAATSTVLRGRGVRQGCGVSPYLFLVVLHWVLQRVTAPLPRFSLDLVRPGLFPLLLGYADDPLVLSDERQDLVAFLGAFRAGLAEVGLALNAHKCEYLVRQPGAAPGAPRVAHLAGLDIPWVDQLVYLGALVTSTLFRQPGIYHRVRKAQRTVAAILPALRAHPLPGSVLRRIHTTVVRPPIAYELSTGSDTQRTRASLRRADGVMRAALEGTARPGRPVPVPPARSITRAVREARVKFRGHIARRPAGHILPRALAFDLHRRKIGRPCFTFRTSLAADLARLPAPPEGWAALLEQKEALARYLRDVEPDVESSEEDGPARPAARQLYPGSESDSD
ncbi:Transposon TX1 uncharacterized 149 kDa protein [Frankliniella fusca]|uniref:Transposon TX1 uncharacterized 149 kDa protein n=1 Tax=Frankliniella fusca TaxID=407009 RepID=A0AAE1GQQ8_9NEOP|nr:Transposon TX1 uncharacterized 149 kDa protein [Frankliniella fusca]